MSKTSVNTETLANARYLDRVQHLLTRSLSRLSSGSKVVTPADDPQGVGLAGKLVAQNKRVNAASINVQNAVSYLQSADGLIGSMNRMVTRMSELKILSTDVMKNGGDIALYQTEFLQIQQQLRATIGGSTAEIGGATGVSKPLGSYNGLVLYGPNPTGLTIATGETPNDNITIPETNLRDGSMLQLIQQDAAGNFTLSLTDAGASAAIEGAIQEMADERGTIGAVARRFDLVAARLMNKSEDLMETVSSIQDVDVAREATRLAKYQFLSQGATTMLARVNESPRSVLQLLRDAV